MGFLGCSMIYGLAVVILLTSGCQRDRVDLEGRYEATRSADQDLPHIVLELRSDGRGFWTIEEDRVSFNWEVRENELWLHTKGGGVIVGHRVRETIDLNLPNVGTVYFRKGNYSGR